MQFERSKKTRRGPAKRRHWMGRRVWYGGDRAQPGGRQAREEIDRQFHKGRCHDEHKDPFHRHSQA